MKSKEFLDECLGRCRDYLERGTRVAEGVPLDRLNHVPMSGDWSPAQVYQHLLLAHSPYEKIIAEGEPTLPVEKDSDVKNTWIGKMIAKMAGPGTNAPAPKEWVPQDVPLPLTIVDEWAGQLQNMINILDRTRGKDLNDKFMRNPLMPLVKMNMADCALILANHTQRHIEQIEERIAKSC